MNKRGQIYILAAVIVCMVAFLLVTKLNFIREQVVLQNFKDISNNYLTESPKVVNDVIESESEATTLDNVQTDLSDFTKNFLDSYAKNQDPNIGLIYIYNDKNGVVIQNSLNKETVKLFGSDMNEPLKILDFTTASINGIIRIDGTGLDSLTNTGFCDKNYYESYCIFESKYLDPEVTLTVGDIEYNFKVKEDAPELIVILKSHDENTVKVDVSESILNPDSTQSGD